MKLRIAVKWWSVESIFALPTVAKIKKMRVTIFDSVKYVR